MSKTLNANSFISQWQQSFEEIQCYQDSEVKDKLSALLDDNELLRIINDLFSLGGKADQVNFIGLRNIDSVAGFQSWVAEHLFPIIRQTYHSLTVTGLDDLDPTTPYVFISNHRDIVMDPLILNKALREHGFATTNCAIGDNLLKHPAANDLALLNRCFKVFRSLKSPRAMLKAMKTQSEYIRYLHFSKQEHVWIAQKEGRAKDNIDKTNPALIKMLGLGKPKDHSVSDYLTALNIVPVSFSYEWDPCDLDKARELIEIEKSQHYEKDSLDDFISTKKGLAENKGRIHLAFGKPLTIEPEYDFKDIAQLIDASIQENYHPFPVNYAGYKQLNANNLLESSYSKQELNQAAKQLEERLQSADEYVSKKVYAAYSQVLLKN
jgi:hypothetical protein